MLRKMFMFIMAVAISSGVKAQQEKTIEESFKNFCAQKGYPYLSDAGFSSTINEKSGLVELKKGQLTIQFASYNRGGDEKLYVYSYFKDTCCSAPEIISACYTYNATDGWKDVTSEVMPDFSFTDFYGPDVAPPSQYLNTVQYRYVLHKNNQLHVVIEPSGVKLDEKFIRIFEQRKYAAVQTKWNSGSNKFEIQKWLK
jgi:hypothetical protein